MIILLIIKTNKICNGSEIIMTVLKIMAFYQNIEMNKRNVVQ